MSAAGDVLSRIKGDREQRPAGDRYKPCSDCEETLTQDIWHTPHTGAIFCGSCHAFSKVGGRFGSVPLAAWGGVYRLGGRTT